MRLIINSYLKTFIKNWVSTMGILFFIIMLGAVVLGMMTTPLQLNIHISSIEKKTTKYDYKINDGTKYTNDFTYNYFLLNGYKYTTVTNGTKVLNALQNFEVIDPDQLQSKIDHWNNLEQIDEPTFLSKSIYILIDQYLTQTVTDSNVPSELQGKTWIQMLDPAIKNSSLSAEANQYLEDLLANLGSLINYFIYFGQESANQNLEFKINLVNEENKNNIINLVINDLKNNLNVKDEMGTPYFSSYQQLYLANNFLKINLGTQFLPVSSLDEITVDQFENLTELILTGITSVDATFRAELINYDDNVNSFLLNNIFQNSDNKNSVNKQGQLAFSLDSAIEYSLVRSQPGLLTPEFSVDVRTATSDQNFNQLILEDGSLPVWSTGQTPEVILSSAFMKNNNLKIGDYVSLPSSSFGQNIDKTEDFNSWVTGNDVSLKIVGTGVRYDELTPGSGYINYVQDFDTYTYAYLPANFTKTFKKASFIYGDFTNKSYTKKINFRVKNNETTVNPRSAFDIDFNNSESVFMNSTTLVQNLHDLMTIQNLNNINIQVVIYNVLGILCLFLAFIFINFIIKKEINETRRQLGIFKSFGYKTSELSLIFSIKTLITIFVGMLIGWLCSFPVQIYMGTNFESSVIFSYQSIYFNAILVFGIFIIIPGLFMLISYLITLKYLNESALSLINNSNRIGKHPPKMGWISRSLVKKGKGFNYRLRRSFVKKSKGKFVVVQILFGVSALLYTLMFGAEALMYQAIEQGFAVLKDTTDHEYQWENRNQLVINQTTDGKYSMTNIDDYDSADQGNKIDYINYQNYENPNEAMNVDANISPLFNDSRYRFRMLTEALSNSIVDKNQDFNKTDNWFLLPTAIAEKKFASGYQDSTLNIISTNYYLYKLLLFKGLNENNSDFNEAVKETIDNDQPFKGNLLDLKNKYEDMWLSLADLVQIINGAPGAGDIFKQTLFGMVDINDQNLSNNLFLTDLSRILSMIFAEDYATKILQQKLNEISQADEDGKYPKDDVDKALQQVYKEVLTNKNTVLYNYDPRNDTYWNALTNPLLVNNSSQKSLADADTSLSSSLGDILDNLSPTMLGLLTSSMLAKSSIDLNNESVLNFNKFFYNSEKEHLQLYLDVLPTSSYDVGPMTLDLVDVKNQQFGDARNQFNFGDVSESEYQQLSEKPDDPNTFYGIVPYAVAKKLNLKKGDTLEVLTSTQSKETIKIIVSGINKSITMPVNFAWVITLDYSTFANNMFSDPLKEKIGLNQQSVAEPYLFNSILSQNPMLAGTFNLKKIPDSLKTFKFVGNQLTLNLEKGSSALGSLLSDLLVNTSFSDFLNNLNLKLDVNMNLVTNPMIMSQDSTKLVALPYNIAKVGIYNFTQTMVQIMVVFLLLQSILLTIILIVIMNIVVNESAVVILTLRSLGYLPKEINWIVMGSYVIGTIVSFILAYVLSLVLWKIFLIVAADLWRVYVFLPFDWKSLVIPVLILGSIMFIGWMASNYQVNRNSLTQITNFV